ncbi:S8 family peptidase [Rhizobium jaguaris]|uniref:Peptidase S8 n=1 Tax=Rhizobium jaguaris TaxID=1312183 RepID=A0A387G1N7_9HYPH|nr:S8 family peptidase [Rhizobium jaguaris]AYG64448.1 peptidase S8 [Rhizobium jaguaris]
MAEQRKSVIITFKAKEKRPDKEKDKLEIVRAAIAQEAMPHFLDATSLPIGAGRPVLEDEAVGYDVNQYEAPIVSAKLLKSEMDVLRKNANVANVEEDAPCYAIGSALQHLQIENQPAVMAETIPVGVAQILAPAAWGNSQGKGIRVGVVDTGIDFNHPDLKTNYGGGMSFVPGAPTPLDDQGHGTHCAGTIAAAINGAGVVGVAPQASLYAVKVLDRNGSGQFSWVIAGIDWCIQNKMHIISMSLGGSAAPTALQTICNVAWDRGLLIVAAAGNAQIQDPVPPAASNVGFPGKYKNVISVSAIDSGNVITSFSSRGAEVDVCAPGLNVLSTAPGGGYATMSGTSMACPHVAGAAALTWGAHRFSNNEQIWNLLASTVDNLGMPGWDRLYGYGRVNANAASGALVPPPTVPKRGV